MLELSGDKAPQEANFSLHCDNTANYVQGISDGLIGSETENEDQAQVGTVWAQQNQPRSEQGSEDIIEETIMKNDTAMIRGCTSGGN